MPDSSSTTRPPLPGGLPAQGTVPSGRAVFTEAYALIPHDSLQDITASLLPHWKGMRAWVLARPMSGFSETFSHYLTELQPGGGSDAPECDPDAQSAMFVTHGGVSLVVDGRTHQLQEGGYAYVAAGSSWKIKASHDGRSVFHWIRKRYVPAEGIDRPETFVTNVSQVEPTPMPECDGLWSTTMFVDPLDLRHDMHLNIVNFQPGGAIPFAETHVMEHGLYVLEGEGDYLLNTDWIKVKAGDFMWLRAFCPQACKATGDGPFRYLLYKDVNRHMPLAPPAAAPVHTI